MLTPVTARAFSFVQRGVGCCEEFVATGSGNATGDANGHRRWEQ